MALAIVVCNAFINAGLPAFTGSYADWVKQNAREGDLVITLGCGDIYKASKMMVKKD